MERARVLVVENDEGRAAVIRALDLGAVDLEVLPESRLIESVRANTPDIVCGDWYIAPGKLSDAATWLILWCNHKMLRVDMVTVRSWVGPNELARIVVEAVMHRERRLSAGLPADVQTLIARASDRARRMFALAVARHAAANLLGLDSSLYQLPLLLYAEAKRGHWGTVDRRFGLEIRSTVETMSRLLVDGGSLGTGSPLGRRRLPRAEALQLYYCCRAAMLDAPRRAAEEAAMQGVMPSGLHRRESFMIALARCELGPSVNGMA